MAGRLPQTSIRPPVRGPEHGQQLADQFVDDLVEGRVHPARAVVVEQPVDPADERRGGEPVVATRRLAAFGGGLGLGPDEVDPAGAAGQPLFLQARADADDLDEGDAHAPGVAGDVGRVGAEDRGGAFGQRQVAGVGRRRENGLFGPVVDLEVEGGEHVLQGAELLVELAGGEPGGLAEGRHGGGAVAGGVAEELERGVEEAPPALGLALCGGLAAVASRGCPEPARHPHPRPAPSSLRPPTDPRGPILSCTRSCGEGPLFLTLQ